MLRGATAELGGRASKSEKKARAADAKRILEHELVRKGAQRSRLGTHALVSQKDQVLELNLRGPACPRSMHVHCDYYC